MHVYYLEFVSDDVDAVCATQSECLGVTFGECDPFLGNARTAVREDGSMIGVRAPMHETETPIVRPYFLVDDIEATVALAKDRGADVALPPMDLPSHGRCAIVIQGGSQVGFWQKPSE